jgi:FkbM family methyltransferase
MSGALAALLGLVAPLHVADVGAAALGDEPPYAGLVDDGLAHLHAFDPDPRQAAGIGARWGERVTHVDLAIGDGSERPLYMAKPASGMTSTLRPDPARLRMFNGFEAFGEIVGEQRVQTHRLDDQRLPVLSLLKMDIQGGEMAALQGAQDVLAGCPAVQLEVSFVPLYEGQPSFGEIDCWMRGRGFIPHHFADLKRWSLAPILRNNDPRQPFNQLLEADAVYIRDIFTADPGEDQMRRLALIAHAAYRSYDLTGHIVDRLERQGALESGALKAYLALLARR